MLASVLEVYRKEASGLLIGTRRGRLVRVIASVPYQLVAHRTYSSITAYEKSDHRIAQAAQSMGCMIVGGWHSHPESYKGIPVPQPSDSDKKAIKRDGYGPEVILSVSGRPPGPMRVEWRAWRLNSRGQIVQMSGQVK